MMYSRRESSGRPFNPILGLLIVALVLVSLFMLARFVFFILSWLSPVLFIAALILDYKEVTGYGKWLIEQVRKNPIMGILAIVLSVLGFPLVSAFLAGKALLTRNVNKAQKQRESEFGGEFINFEEVEEKPLELPELAKVKRPEKKSPPKEPETRDRKEDSYDELFE